MFVDISGAYFVIKKLKASRVLNVMNSFAGIVRFDDIFIEINV